MPNKNIQTIPVSQLCVGLYIHLDLGWMDHPFTFGNFKIASQSQIETIKKIGVKQLRYDPSRSDCEPAAVSNVIQLPVRQKEELVDPKLALQAKLIERQNALKQAIQESEKKFVHASETASLIQQQYREHPKSAVETAEALINDLVNTALCEGDILVHVVNGNRANDGHFQHGLNSLVLALMLSKNMSISEEEAKILGMSTLLHDIGLAQLDSKILLKKEPLTKAELTLYQQHPIIGASIIKEMGLPKRIGDIVMQHHELSDGTGYPLGLKQAEIDPLTQVLILVNRYDNLCNPVNTDAAKTPYEALGIMFAQQRHLFNEDLLKRFIKCLGIYPPGSIVNLSNDKLATVISVNPSHPLKPYIKLLTLEEGEQGEIIDMREAPNINITRCIKPGQLPAELLGMIRRRERTNYFLDLAI